MLINHEFPPSIVKRRIIGYPTAIKPPRPIFRVTTSKPPDHTTSEPSAKNELTLQVAHEQESHEPAQQEHELPLAVGVKDNLGEDVGSKLALVVLPGSHFG